MRKETVSVVQSETIRSVRRRLQKMPARYNHDMHDIMHIEGRSVGREQSPI